MRFLASTTGDLEAVRIEFSDGEVFDRFGGQRAVECCRLVKADCDFTIAINVALTRDPEATEATTLLDATLGMDDIPVDEVTGPRLERDPPDI